MQLQVRTFTAGPFAENSYLLTYIPNGVSLLIDPGFDGEQLWQAVEQAGCGLAAILLTHAHLDHVGALSLIRERSHAPVYLHPADDDLLAQAHLVWQEFGYIIDPIAPAEHALHHGQQLNFGELKLKVIHTPGHTPGGVCFYAQGQQILIAGDTLFRHGIGRTDLPGGDPAALLRSIRERLFTIEDSDTRAFPGHGLPTTIREEMVANPFVGTRRNA